jgi:hypothetical protein
MTLSASRQGFAMIPAAVPQKKYWRTKFLVTVIMNNQQLGDRNGLCGQWRNHKLHNRISAPFFFVEFYLGGRCMAGVGAKSACGAAMWCCQALSFQKVA